MDITKYLDQINTTQTEEEIRRSQAQMYMWTHTEALKERYAKYIQKQLVKHNSWLEPVGRLSLDNSYEWNKYDNTIRTIKGYMQFQHNTFILHNPKTGEPAVVMDATYFLPGKLQSKEEQNFFEYVINNHGETLSNIAGTIAGKAIEKGLSKKGAQLTAQAGRLQTLARHQTGHAAHMRVTHTYRGKEAQQKAFLQLSKKYEKISIQSARYAQAGAGLTKMATFLGSKSFSAFTEVMTPRMLGDQLPWQERAKRDTIKATEEELIKYCEKNYNFYLITKATFLEQGY